MIPFALFYILNNFGNFSTAIVSIIENPPRNVTLREGETFYITCRTYGIPTPEVIWRFNWGHVPAKCRTTSVNGFGTLTCPGIAVSTKFIFLPSLDNIRVRV